MSKLTPEQEEEILELLKKGKRLTHIAKELGVSYFHVYHLSELKKANLPPKKLTDKEKMQIVELSKTLTVKQISEKLNIPVHKIKSYRQSNPSLFPRTPVIRGEKREFNEDEIQYIVTNYKRIKTIAIAAHLKCTTDAVRKCANDNIGFNGYGAVERVHKCTDKEFRRRCVSCGTFNHKDEHFNEDKNICDDCMKLMSTKREIEAENKTKIVYTPAYLTPRPDMFSWDWAIKYVPIAGQNTNPFSDNVNLIGNSFVSPNGRGKLRLRY
jgi:DNA-binding CsgD family transcriptional regulator